MIDSDRLLVHAALDGEMDAPALLVFERRLASEPELARAYDEIKALRGALRAMPSARTPDALRAKMQALAVETAEPPAMKSMRFARWGSLAATVAALGIGLAVGWTSAPRGPDIEREILAGHLRGLISTRPVDVVSSDQHTVKPWFAGKLQVAPVVVDLAASGFRLEGGRIDIVAGKAAPTLVYRAGKHAISVTRLPVGESLGLASAWRREIDGHPLTSWSSDGATYVATSDASRAELENFAEAFRKEGAVH